MTLTESQLVWRCRRGVRELDVLFTSFVEKEYRQLAQNEQLAFQKLLEVQDPTIMDWLFGKQEVDDAELIDVIKRLQTHSGVNR